MASPTLSVLMPNYNHGRFLRESLGALVSQSYRPKEILVLDDASTDDSVAIIEQFAREHPALRFSRNQRNLGVVGTGRRLVEMSSGDYLFSTAADDKIMPGFLARSMALLERHPRAALCSTLALDIDEHGHENGLVPLPKPRRTPGYLSPPRCRRTLSRHGPWIVGCTTIFRRDAFVAAGGFRPELGPFCDEVLQQVLMLRHGACFIPEPLACWRTLESGFLNATYENTDELIDVLESALVLMGTDWQEVFPRSYLDRFERRRRFSAGRYHLTRGRPMTDQQRKRAFVRILGKLGRLDAAILKRRDGKRASALRLAAQLWLAGRLRVSPLWLLRRSMHKVARAADMRAFVRARAAESADLRE